TALYVVGVDLELGLGVHRRVGRKEQVSVGLARVRLLRVLMDDDLAVKYAAGRTVENPFVELQAGRSRLDVLDLREIVDMLLAGAKIQAVEHALRALAIKRYLHVVAHQRAAQSDRMGGEVAAA